MEFLKNPTRVFFFTGKGGVGKTSLACASAVALADRGQRVLLVSSDPASNLGEVLGSQLGHEPIAISTVPQLFAMNLDPAASAAAYRERIIGPVRQLLPATVVTSMEEQLSGSCTIEIAAFDEFARLLGDHEATAEYDHVIFDTAPTGHTLRLLKLPSAWSEFMTTNTSGTSCLGPLSGLQLHQSLYHETTRALGDGAATSLVLVARPDEPSLQEAARTSGELAALGIHNQHLVVNGLFTASRTDDAIAQAMERKQKRALSSFPLPLARLAQTVVPLSPSAIGGIASLRAIASGKKPPLDITPIVSAVNPLPSLGSLIESLAAPGRGVILTMGKGGVGKTTIAAAIAIALAERGLDVHLTTTDPAAHMASAVDHSTFPNLRISRIDPQVETANYVAEVMTTTATDLDADARAVLAEDLRSPCTEEIAVFRAFARVVAEGRESFVVLDTAPTGHTLLLLDATLAHHREVSRRSNGAPDFVSELLPRLRDSEFTRVLIATLPEATPVHEAAQLQTDLRRAGIGPYAWVINQSLLPLKTVDPLLRSRQWQEQRYVAEVTNEHSQRVALIPWQLESPSGTTALRSLVK